MNPPYDNDLAARMNHWLQAQRDASDAIDPLALASWLEGRLEGRQHVELRDEVEWLLAADPAWLEAALALRDIGAEPVLASEIQAAQALVVATPRFSRWLAWRAGALAALFDGVKGALRQPLPLAFAATLAVFATVASLWMGEMAAIEFGVEDMQSASLLEVTRIDYGATALVAMNDVIYE
jgi:hypothetical protein